MTEYMYYVYCIRSITDICGLLNYFESSLAFKSSSVSLKVHITNYLKSVFFSPLG